VEGVPWPVEVQRLRNVVSVRVTRSRSSDCPPGGIPARYRGCQLPTSLQNGHDKNERRFLKATREWYARWARSPMATRFTEVDWDRLRYVVAPLFDRFIRSSSKELAGELRLQESLLGATLMDRQRLGLRIDGPKPAAQRPSDASQAEFDELLARRLARGA